AAPRRERPEPRLPRRRGDVAGASPISAVWVTGISVADASGPAGASACGVSATGVSETVVSPSTAPAVGRRVRAVRRRGRASAGVSESPDGVDSPLAAARERVRNESHSDSLGGLLYKALDAATGSNFLCNGHKRLCGAGPRLGLG